MTNDKNASLFLRNLPRKLKARFKAICAEEGVTMQDAIVEFMEAKTSRRGDGDELTRSSK